jgi:ATP-dependent DNA helicase RecQ
VQKALSCVYRTGQRFGAGHLIDVLTGKENDRMLQWGHQALPVFGIGTDIPDKEWRGVFRQIVALGLLEVDHAHGALKLTDASRPVLKGEQKIALRRQAERKKVTTRSGRVTKIDSELSSQQRALWDRLRVWRADTAKTHGVPAYVILHDATLLELVRQRPQSKEGLRQISGIGAHKLETYGVALIELLMD